MARKKEEMAAAAGVSTSGGKPNSRNFRAPNFDYRRRRLATGRNLGADCSYLQDNPEHFVSFRKQLAGLGLMLRDIPGDGNCLFRALGDQLEGHGRNHMKHRLDTVRYMAEHPSDFKPFVEDDITFEDYMENLAKSGTYGGQDCLVAFARLHHLNIVIHQLNSPLWQIEGGGAAAAGNRELHLSYHNGEHYSSVRMQGDVGEIPSDIRLPTKKDCSRSGPSPALRRSPTGNRRGSSPPSTSCYESDTNGVVAAIRDVGDIVLSIMDSTGCQDRQLVEETLADNFYNMEATIDYLLSVLLVTSSGLDDDELIVSSSVDAQMPNTCISVPKQPQQKGARPKVAASAGAQKLSNKQRKDLQRREKLERKREKCLAAAAAGHQPSDNFIEGEFDCLSL